MQQFNTLQDQKVLSELPYGGIIEADGCRVLAKKIMSRYDQSSNGFIDPTQISSMIKDCYRSINKSIVPKPGEISGFMNVISSKKKLYFQENSSTRITQQELEIFIHRMFSGVPYSFKSDPQQEQPSYIQERLEVARRLFKKLDLDSSGYITENEVYEIIRETYKQMGMKYEPTVDDVQSWIQMTDSDGDGKVTLQDYENLVLKSLQQQAISYKY